MTPQCSTMLRPFLITDRRGRKGAGEELTITDETWPKLGLTRRGQHVCVSRRVCRLNHFLTTTSTSISWGPRFLLIIPQYLSSIHPDVGNRKEIAAIATRHTYIIQNTLYSNDLDYQVIFQPDNLTLSTQSHPKRPPITSAICGSGIGTRLGS